MKQWQSVLLLLFSVFLFACTDQEAADREALAKGELRESTKALVLDGSSEAAFNRSLEEATEHMTQLERDVFSVALLELMLDEVNRLDQALAQSQEDIEELPEMYEPFDGMTVGEVVAKAEALKQN